MLIRKIGVSELAMVLSRRLVIGLRGLDFALVAPEMNIFTIDLYPCPPGTSPISYVDTFIYRYVFSRTFPPVAAVLRVSRQPQIRLSIIQAVAVDVVN